MAVVKASFVKRGKVGNAKAKDNVRYIQHRPDKDKEAVMRPLFGSDGPMTRLEAYQFIDEAPKGTKFFTIIINPDPDKEDTHKDLDMRALTMTTMQTIEEIITAQGITTPVVWVAALHDDHTGLDHGVGHPLLLLYDVKAPNGQKSNEFNGLNHYPSSIS
jgi:hypothetical protein